MRFFTKKRIIIISLILAAIAAVVWYSVRGSKKSEYNFIILKKTDLTQEVSVSGKVKPATSVDLAFEKGGKVARVSAHVGDKVVPGQVVVALENSELSAQLLQAIASWDSEKAKLAELEKGTRPEEISSARTKVANAERSLLDAKSKLESVELLAQADLRNVYESAKTAAQQAVLVGKSSLLTLTDIQFAHFGGSDQDANEVAEAKAEAVLLLLGETNAGRLASDSLSLLNGGAYGAVQAVVASQNYTDIDSVIAKTVLAVQAVKLALNTVPVSTTLSTTEKTDLSTAKDNVAAEVTTISTKQQAVLVQKADNTKAISTASSDVISAENTLANAKDDLALKLAGTIPEQVSAQRAKVKSAEANVQNIQAQLDKTLLKSPIQGVVTLQDAKVGEIVAADTKITSLISEALFEIEANIPEADIAKIKINDKAKVTLDAYGNEVIFEAEVISIDPAEKVIEGVATYKTTLRFIGGENNIRSGMTANLDIKTAARQNILAVPQRSVVTVGGKKTVKVLSDNGAVKEILVETGLRGSDGNIEIISGLKEGDKVITFISEK